MLGSPRRRLSGSKVRIAVAAYGKHPAWRDHIDEDVLIAAESDELAFLERWLHGDIFEDFVTKSAIHNLSPANLIPLDHLIVRSTDIGCSLTRIWASTDYSGRARFPMVLSVDAEGFGVDDALARILPPLESTANTIRQLGDNLRARIDSEDSARAGTIDTGDTRRAVRDAVEDLRRQLASITAPSEAEPDFPAILRDLRAHPDSGPADQGLARVLYRLKPPDSGTRPMTRSSSGRRWRLPCAAETPEQSIRRWLTLLTYLAPDAPTLTLALPRQHPWVDLFIGEVAMGELERLSLSEQAEGIESHTAYSAVDAEYIARIQAQLDEWLRSGPPAAAARQTTASDGRAQSTSSVSPNLGERLRKWFGGS